ncbi:hypothetical protein [Geitlerinema sp. PCC 9228]|uniref:hypothetical protein n=1 Tax=Geitlerinema sp. PCC 9228 TaxID=111611 RepID=UPI0008F9D18A|nr:hypothetical protein [Geitlerinema sp. PCC 9228]
MTSSYQKIFEVSGTPGQLVGGLIFPNFGGTTTVKIDGEMVHEKAFIGSEKRESFTRLNAIDHVGIYDSSIGFFLAIAAIFFGLGSLSPFSEEVLSGINILFFGLSVLFFLGYSLLKYRYLLIHSQRNTIIIFITKSPYTYRQFALTIMDAIAGKIDTELTSVSQGGSYPKSSQNQ